MIRNDTDTVEPLATQHGTLRLRPETEADTSFLFTLHESVKGAELASIAEPIRRQLLEMQFRAMSMGYHSGFPAGRFEIIALDDAPIGRLITDDSQGRIHTVYIGLLPEWRNRGICTILMTAVLDQPRRRGIPCEAIVAVENLPSLRLWSRLGFTERERNESDVIVGWRPS